MKSIKWIDLLIKKKNLPSDRQAALLLGMSSALMSQHRTGKVITLDDQNAYKLEKLLELPHGKIVLDQHAEREKDPEVKSMWQKLAGSVAVVTLSVVVLMPNKTEASQLVSTGTVIENPRVGGSIPPLGTIYVSRVIPKRLGTPRKPAISRFFCPQAFPKRPL
ncbi:uncharacterized protein DUF3693 [Azomonas agilis]|uniref:Uncharacterized protein DUF3693 n=1 Tax=Azomonas agilis TaxID=116849 RepID=A0A562IZ06_9GAMM|nr:DUF3693 domain-containing protein [Azomonas agilis]TWH76187.1 uncharacterized protein DUF3693 [Azomonas agilis]